MATATTEMDKHCALLALVREGPDEDAAASVTAFTGDINAYAPVEGTVLHAAVERLRPLTVAALAARGDCNPNVARFKIPVLCRVAGPCGNRTNMATLLVHFPTLDVDACDSGGYTPLHYAAHWGRNTNAQLLLDAGADPTVRSLNGNGFTPAELARKYGFTLCAEQLEAAAAWHSGLRREWLRAVVGISKNVAI